MGFLWATVGVLTVLMVICLLALVDQYRTLELIRAKLKLEDNPEPIFIPDDRPVAPSAIGLPAELDDRPHLVVLFLSTSCNTCRTIAEGLRGRAVPDVWVVLNQAHTVEEGAEWLAAMGLSTDRATIDVEGRVAKAIGIDVIPAMVLYREGEPALAQTIPSYRQLDPLLSPRTSPSSLKFAKEGTVRI